MYEEDRAQVLAMYGDIFDEIGNDTAILQLLVSPTRQAVNLARAYDAKDRAGESENAPAYLGVIEALRKQAGSLFPAVPRLDDAQFSLFNEPVRQEPQEHTENVFESLGFDLPDIEEFDVEKEELPEEPPEGLSRFPDEDRAESAAPAPVPPPAFEGLPAESQEKTPDQELDDFADSVAAFLADFGSADAAPAEESPAAPGQSLSEEPAPVLKTARSAEKETPVWTIPAKPDASAAPNVPGMKEKAPIVWLMILMIVLAIPVGLAGVGLLLIPAAAALGLSALALSVGFYGFVLAFTAFSVFADILLVFGLSLALVAFGLLFFWLFVWLLAGVIPSLIRALCGVIKKYSYKEVSV